MSGRSEIENKYTVECFHCEYEIVDPARAPHQKYIRHQPCPNCKQLHPDDQEE